MPRQEAHFHQAPGVWLRKLDAVKDARFTALQARDWPTGMASRRRACVACRRSVELFRRSGRAGAAAGRALGLVATHLHLAVTNAER